MIPKKFSKTTYPEIVLIVGISILSFMTFYFLFSSTEDGGYYQNVLSALMGTLFTVVITSFLLKQQVKSEELREQNVEVFKKKVEKYENLILTLTDVVEDGEISHIEAKKITRSIYEISLFCGKDVLELVGNFLKQEIIGNFDEDEKITILEITSKMREELHLEGIETFGKDDLRPIEFLISSNFELVPLYKEIYIYLHNLREEVSNILFDTEKPYCVGAIENLGDRILFPIDKDESYELDSYIVEIALPSTKSIDIELFFRVMKHSGIIDSRKHEKQIIEASKFNIEYIIDEDFPKEISGSKSTLLKINESDGTISTTSYNANDIIKDIEKTEDVFKSV